MMRCDTSRKIQSAALVVAAYFAMVPWHASAVEASIEEIISVAKSMEDRIENLRLKVDFESIAAEGVLDRPEGMPEELMSPLHKREESVWTYEPSGRRRIETQVYRVEAGSNTLTPFLDRSVRTWDGATCMFSTENPDQRTVRYLKFDLTAPIRQPLMYSNVMGAPLSQFLQAALGRNAVSILPAEDSELLKLEVKNSDWMGRKGNERYVLTIDSSKNFYVARTDMYLNGMLVDEVQSVPMLVEDGIWLPKTGKRVLYAPGQPEPIRFQETMTIHQAEVNVEEFPDDLFTIPLTPGCLVIDMRPHTALQYTYQADGNEPVGP